jgi:uncharacterized protein YaaR (DUF327 family)
MEYMAFVKKENVSKADNKLREDFDLAAKQSISIRDAKSLGLEDEGSYFLISGSNEGVEKCKELLKEFVEEVPEEKLKKAKEEMDKESEIAAQGFGGIFG